MFKLIGGFVVCGFALYGLATYLKGPVVKLVIDPGMLRTQDAATPASAEGDDASSPLEKGPAEGIDDQTVPAAT